MKNVAVIGAQWGDEGKGKIIDYFVDHGYKIVARYNGGPNAGHTTYYHGKKLILHVIPSAISHRGVTCVIGNGVVIDPSLLLDEISHVRSAGIGTDRLVISDSAKVITPYEKAMERLSPAAREIGTTGRGIGPAYMTNAARVGVFVSDFYRPAGDIQRLLKNLDEEFMVSERLERAGEPPIDSAKVAEDYAALFRELNPHVRDTVHYLNRELGRSPMLFEGAQGTFLDLDLGTRPYVTSSRTISGGVATGLGIPSSAVNEVVGVMKAGYLTRVGGGPLLGELGTEQSIKGDKRLTPAEFERLREKVMSGNASDAEVGKYHRDEGDEFGASTGRPRRVAWPDVPLIKYASMVNGIDWLALTKIDVSDFVPEIPFITGYEMDGRDVEEFRGVDYGNYTPVFGRRVRGSMKTTRGVQNYADLSESAKEIVNVWNDVVPVGIVSTGPESHETIFMQPFSE